MKNGFLITLTLVIASYICSTGQDIQQIRKLYNMYAAQISACESGAEECELYCNTQKTNALNQVWRGVGAYSSTLKFWYDDSPSNCDECGEDGIYVLKKVVKETVSGQYIIHEEWLFSNGELTFYYLKNNEEQMIEDRLYLANGKPFLYSENGVETDLNALSNEYLAGLLSKAKNLQKLFLLGF